MKKISVAIILVVSFVLSLSVTAFAAAEEYVYDHNGNLTAVEIAQLNDLAADIPSKYGFDVLIDMDDSVTENAYDYAARRYAEVGGADNGILLVVTAEKWCIHLAGEAENVFGESYVEYLWDAYNVEKTYFGGVESYIIAAEAMLQLYYEENVGAATGTPEIPEARLMPRMVDDAGLLTAAERSELLARLDEISERHACDVAIVTVNSLGNKTAEAYADDYFDYNGYGIGNGYDGILLLISMEDRDWAITTHGFAIPAFTDAGQAYMVSQFKPDLSDGSYASAFNIFAELCDDFLSQAKSGEPYDKGHLPNTMGFVPFFLRAFAFFLPLGFIVALFITNVMKKKLKSVVMQKAANSYVRNGSINITASRDKFLNRIVNKTARVSESSSSGGSSTHTSSSGRTHGGSSGKF